MEECTECGGIVSARGVRCGSCKRDDEIKRLQEMLRTIAFRAQDAKRLCEEGAPVSAHNLASGILGQIGGDVPALTAKYK